MIIKPMRVAHVMKPIKDTTCPSNFLFFDTETRGQINRDNPQSVNHYLWFGYALAFRLEKGKRTRLEECRFESAQDFWEFLLRRCSKQRPLYVFAHNMTFDLTIVDFWYQADPLGITINYAVFDDPPFVLNCSYKDSKIIFLDTLNYWRTSLKMLGESVGLPKLDMPLRIKPQKQWDTYCRRDTEIIALAVEEYIKYIHEHELGPFSVTQASQSMKAFKHRFMKHPIYVHTNDEVLSVERDGYYGGLVHCYFVGRVRQKLYKLDVNSLYPAMMLNNMPTKLIATFKTAPLANLRSWTSEHGVIAQVLLDSKKEPFPYRTKYKLYERVGKFFTTLCGPELERAINFNNIVGNASLVSIYEMAPIFTDFVQFFWSERQRFKRAGNATYEYFCKVFMNSLYGKFGQRGYDWIDLNIESIKQLYDTFNVAIPNEYHRQGFQPEISWSQRRWYPLGLTEGVEIRGLSGKVQIRLPRGEHYESCPIIAAYVTSYGRERLRELVRLAGNQSVYYVDTDSLIVNHRGYLRLKKAGEIDPNKIGKLKLEEVADYAEFWNPKHYVFGRTETIKGIRKDAIKIGDKDYLQNQFEGIRSIMRRDPKPYIKIEWIEKQLVSEFDKGIVTPSGWVNYHTNMEG